jgi:antitoxin Phd
MTLVGIRLSAFRAFPKILPESPAFIEEANSKGPQFITRHGAERAVILSVKDYRALTAHKPDLKEYLLGGPKVDRFDVPRSRDKGSKVPATCMISE